MESVLLSLRTAPAPLNPREPDRHDPTRLLSLIGWPRLRHVLPVRMSRSRRSTAAVDRGTAGEPEPERIAYGSEEEERRLAEELVLLEEEAMAGKDEGRAPTDYDRRARIFRDSSRLFREIKGRDGEPDPDLDQS